MNNRLPLYILGLLVLVALIWRIFNPPVPVLPGPLGSIPHWNSSIVVGEMGPAAVSPDATIWAGAWNDPGKDDKPRSAVVTIDLLKKTTQHTSLGTGYAQSLFWHDDGSFSVLVTDSNDPAEVDRSVLATCRASGTEAECKKKSLPIAVASILVWLPDSDRFVARLAGDQVKTALMDTKGQIVGKETVVDVPKSAKFYRMAALSPDGHTYVFGVEKSKLGGTQTFYQADSATGQSKELFTSRQLPGIVEGMWVSPTGVLIVASELGKLSEVRYDFASGKITNVKGKAAADVAKSWADLPAKMMFVTYNGGYQLDPRSGKVKRLFEFEASDRNTAYWRQEVQGGRLYPRKGGGYTSVSYVGGAVDIRVIGKDGASTTDILRRR